MDKVEQAVTCFKEGFNCAQALLVTYASQFGLDPEHALKISGAFGGGIGRTGEVCGAVTGAVMIIGLKYGQTNVSDKRTREKAYSLVKEFINEFEARNKSIICRKLLGFDMGTRGRKNLIKLFKEKKRIHSICPKFVQDSVEIIENIFSK
jgi:C_GCAxxG_C_C family probable redox protein